MSKRVLMVAYHFPPLAGSSGVQRTLRFVQHLPALGWQPLVLTANARAYERTAEDLLHDVPAGTVVRRAFALDAARHLSIARRHIGATARPDRWMSWKFDAVRQGLKLIREFKPQVIWSTFPLPTAHVIARALHQRSGLPWIADFRDPMAQEGYPTDPQLWTQFDRIERETVTDAARSVFTTPGAARIYRERYPAQAHKVVVLENGYDEESFASAERGDPSPQALVPGAITLLHSGIIYPAERDPGPLMAALQQLKEDGLISSRDFRVRFRAAVHDALLHDLARRHGVDDLIETAAPVGYGAALQEMLRADGLLLMQSAGCNEQIPAKAYEYLRAGRPVLCLTDPAGDTAGVMRQAGLGDIARLDDARDIAQALARFVGALRDGRVVLPQPQAVRMASRQGRSERLAALLDELA